MSEPRKTNYAQRAEQVEHLPPATRLERLRNFAMKAGDVAFSIGSWAVGAVIGYHVAQAAGWTPAASIVAGFAGGEIANAPFLYAYWSARAEAVRAAATGDKTFRKEVQGFADRRNAADTKVKDRRTRKQERRAGRNRERRGGADRAPVSQTADRRRQR